MDVFESLNAAGRTIVLVTHDANIAARCRRVARIEEGRLVDDGHSGKPRRDTREDS
jgi:predicted ABC-type transport system involved in lysophospholipase L1 biosynthesis ATPase subunit